MLDDARHFLLTTEEKFDAITSDPLDPWVKGAAMLYTKEFFETVKSHLNPGGAVTLFVQLYESNTAAVKSEIATFLEVFPGGVVWGNTNNGAGYDLVLLGQAEPTRIDVEAVQRRLSQPGDAAGRAVARRDRHVLGGGSVLELCRDEDRSRRRGSPTRSSTGTATCACSTWRAWASTSIRAKPSTPTCCSTAAIPDDLFIGSDATKQSLRAAIMRMQGK